MKNLKVMLPMTAFIFAVLMSFTTNELKDGQANDYIRPNGAWEAISEVNCGNGPFTCRVQFGQNGQPHKVYDQMDLKTLKSSSSEDPILIQ